MTVIVTNLLLEGQEFTAHKPAAIPTNRDRCQENKKTHT